MPRPTSRAAVATPTYRGADVPKPGEEPVPANLCVFGGAAPSDTLRDEVVVEAFVFTA